MKRILWPFCALCLLSYIASTGLAQRRDRDPLTEKEVDEMREAADYPNKRLELMIGFAKARLATIDQLRADPASAATRPKQIHELLQDFIILLDETDDNVDMYASHRADMRKGLKLLIEANSEWQLKLRQLKEQSPSAELEQYSFVLTNAVDTVADSGQSARENLQEQNKLAQDKQLIKDYSERKD
jgi:hypothetical protein